MPDFKNVSIVGHYVKDRTKDAQFIIIRYLNKQNMVVQFVQLECNLALNFLPIYCSLRNNMFELADRLVGIYKTDNCTKSITINPGSFVVSQKAA